MPYEVEQIADEELVTRLVDFPRMMTPDGSALLNDPTFPFSKDRVTGEYLGESVNLDKYAPPPEAVHLLGCRRQAIKQEKNPNMRYAGYIAACVGGVRAIRTARGHGFTIKHVPSDEEGRHHAEVYFAPCPDNPKLSSLDRAELRETLVKIFSPIVPHQCPELPAQANAIGDEGQN